MENDKINLENDNNIQQTSQSQVKSGPIIDKEFDIRNDANIAKAVKTLKNDIMVLIVVSILLIVLYYFSKGEFLIFNFIYLIFLLFEYNLVKKEEKIAGNIGIIIGVLMMLSIINYDLLDFLLGLFLFMHSNKYIKALENE